MTSSRTADGSNNTFKKKVVWSQGWDRNTYHFVLIQEHLVSPQHNLCSTKVHTFLTAYFLSPGTQQKQGGNSCTVCSADSSGSLLSC